MRPMRGKTMYILLICTYIITHILYYILIIFYCCIHYIIVNHDTSLLIYIYAYENLCVRVCIGIVAIVRNINVPVRMCAFGNLTYLACSSSYSSGSHSLRPPLLPGRIERRSILRYYQAYISYMCSYIYVYDVYIFILPSKHVYVYTLLLFMLILLFFPLIYKGQVSSGWTRFVLLLQGYFRCNRCTLGS